MRHSDQGKFELRRPNFYHRIIFRKLLQSSSFIQIQKSFSNAGGVSLFGWMNVGGRTWIMERTPNMERRDFSASMGRSHSETVGNEKSIEGKKNCPWCETKFDGVIWWTVISVHIFFSFIFLQKFFIFNRSEQKINWMIRKNINMPRKVCAFTSYASLFTLE